MIENYTHITRIIYDDPRTEEYRQKYQDAMDEIQRLNSIIEDLTETIKNKNEIIGDMTEALDELGTELAMLEDQYYPIVD